MIVSVLGLFRGRSGWLDRNLMYLTNLVTLYFTNSVLAIFC